MTSNPIRLAVVLTHPVQYYSPVFQHLAHQEAVQLKVFYGWTGLTQGNIDPGFGRNVRWDIPLLEGYEYEFLENVAAKQGTHDYYGIDVPDIDRKIAAWQPDVTAVYGWSYKAHWQLLKRLHRKIPILFRGDSHLLDERPGLKQVMRRLWLTWVYRHIDHALAVGTENIRYYQRHGIAKSRITLAPHAVDNARFQQDHLKADGQKLRLSHGIADNQVAIGFVGKLETKKAPEMLLAALQASGREDLVLVYVGTGELESTLASKSHPQVRMLGFRNQSELPAVYHMLDVLALPSRGPGETWGLVVNEAMAAGKPCIVSDAVGCGIDLVKPTSGWICRRNNEADLTRILGELPGRVTIQSIGKRCLDHLTDWSLERQVQGWLTALTKLCPHR